jgi:enoyl-CoA hydratase
MADAICAALNEAEQRMDVGAPVVRADGPVFCAGADVDLLTRAAQDPLDPTNFEAIDGIYNAFYQLGQVGIPTIAAVRGAAVGAGLNLLMATDLRIVARDSRLVSGFGPRGLHPGGGHMHLLSRLAGREVAAALALFGEEVSGERAERLGLAWLALDAAEVDTYARNLARRVAAHPLLARKLVSSLREESESQRLGWRAAIEFERVSQMWSMRNKG